MYYFGAAARSERHGTINSNKAERSVPHLGAAARRRRLVAEHLRERARRQADPVFGSRAPWRSGPRARRPGWS